LRKIFFFFLAFWDWFFFPFLSWVLNPKKERKEKNIPRKKERKKKKILNY